MTNNIDLIKQNIRKQRTIARNAITKTNVSTEIIKNFFDYCNPKDKIVAGYFPIKSELDVLPLIKKCREVNSTICLPFIIGKNQPLIFKIWNENEPLIQEKLGTFAPNENSIEIIPDIIITPMLAFNKDKYRLGYGGGFYDRTFSNLKNNNINKIGIAFEEQYYYNVPTNAYDIQLDAIITEQNIYI